MEDIKTTENKIAENKVQLKNSPFVEDTDTFDVKVIFYKDGNKVFIKDFTEKFDDQKPADTISFTIRYPSAGDCSAISTKISTIPHKAEIDTTDFTRMETVRLLFLLKSWSLPEKLDNDTIFKMHPYIIRCVCNRVTEEIGALGIV